MILTSLLLVELPFRLFPSIMQLSLVQSMVLWQNSRFTKFVERLSCLRFLQKPCGSLTSADSSADMMYFPCVIETLYRCIPIIYLFICNW